MTLVANLRKLCAGPLKVPQSECQQPSNPSQEPTIQNSNYVNSNRSRRNIKAQPGGLSYGSSPLSRHQKAGKVGKAGKAGKSAWDAATRTTCCCGTGCSNIFTGDNIY